jgi:Flp pilus assembly protein TadG
MRARNSRKGQTLILFVLVLPLLMGAMGLAVDLGWLYYRKQAATAAAEAAALAAVKSASAYFSSSAGCSVSNNVVCQQPARCPTIIPNPPATDFDVACQFASQNGFAVTSGGSQNVMVSAGSGTPPTVNGVNAPYWVTVEAAESVPQSFSSVLGNTLGTTSGRATAAYFNGGSGGGCIYILNAAANIVSAVLNNNTTLEIGCGFLINAQTSNAIQMGNGSQIQLDAGASINVAATQLNQVLNLVGSIVNVNALLYLGAPAAPNPFSSLPVPSYSGCDNLGVLALTGTQSLSPGTYCGPVILSGNVAATLSSGTYIFEGGLSVSGAASINGNGVTIYQPSGALNINTTGSVTLTPPATGTYQGITIFQNASDAASGTIAAATQNIQGVIYMPTAQLTLSGNSKSIVTTATIVVGNLVIAGNVTINFPTSTSYTPHVVGVTLIE